MKSNPTVPADAGAMPNTFRPEMPPPCADWKQGNVAGRAFADDFLSRMEVEEAPFMLGHLVQHIAETGRFDGVTVGFFQRISECALHGLRI